MQKYKSNLQDAMGRARPNAKITVLNLDGSTAEIYADRSGTPLANPVTTNKQGEFEFYAANGRYSLRILAPGYPGETDLDVVLTLDPDDFVTQVIDPMFAALTEQLEESLVGMVEEATEARDDSQEAAAESAESAADANTSKNAAAGFQAGAEQARNDAQTYSDGVAYYATRALLNTDLTAAAPAFARVYADPDTINNGEYYKVGAGGTGSWEPSDLDRVTRLDGKWRAPDEVAGDRLLGAAGATGQSTRPNLLDFHEVVPGYFLDETGAVTASETLGFVPDFIPVLEDQVFTSSFSGAIMAVLYDASKAFVSVAADEDVPTPTTFTIPPGVFFMRPNVVLAGNAYGETYLVAGDAGSATREKAFTVAGLNVSHVLPSQMAGATAVDRPNLLSGAEYVNGFYLSPVNGLPLESNAASYTRNYIPVVPGRQYEAVLGADPNGYGVMYDSDLTFVGGIPEPVGDDPPIVTPPDGVRYVRLNAINTVPVPRFTPVDSEGAPDSVRIPWARIGAGQMDRGAVDAMSLQGAITAADLAADLLDGATYVAGKYLGFGGVVADFANFKYTSNYIPAVPGRLYQKSTGELFSGVFYDVNLVPIATIQLSDGAPSSVFRGPHNVAWMRVNIQVADAAPFLRATLGNEQKVFVPWLDRGESQSSQWAGKIIAIYGTSIPAGYPHQDDRDTYSYANRGILALGGIPYNVCVPNGVIRAAKADGSPLTGGRDVLSLSNLGSAVNYQTNILDLIGTVNEPVFTVLGYDVNDGDADPTDINLFDKDNPYAAAMPITSRDRNTFIGAHNWIIDQARAANPRFRFGIVTHFTEDYQVAPNRQHWRKVLDIQEALGNYWGVPVLSVYKSTGWIFRDGIDTLGTYMPDWIHPASDPTGEAVEILTAPFTNWLRGIR